MTDQHDKSIAQHLGEISQWQKDHAIDDDRRFTEINTAMVKLATKEDIQQMVNNSISAVFKGKGTFAKNFIIGTAIILTSITAIVVSIKAMLSWLGFFIIRQ